jgi:alpha-tubulin suppressor-like RCC1 family protein
VATATAVSAGQYQACAVLTDGSVACWGDNGTYALGNGPLSDSATAESLVPVMVTGVGTARAVASGSQQTCALLADGTVQCWGDNTAGELGAGATGTCVDPYSGTFSCSKTAVAATGITNATAVTAGLFIGCALLTGGTVQCWGSNAFGQLGIGNYTVTQSDVPVTVSGLSNAQLISTTYSHTCAVIAGGSIQCWGDNQVGALGNGTTSGGNAPGPVTGINSASAVTAGYEFSCALLANGTVQCWGVNTWGQLGNGTTTDSSVPVQVIGITNATAVSAGGDDACAILSGGTVQCWGLNSAGQLGAATAKICEDNQGDMWPCSSTPITVAGITSATSISVGQDFVCALLHDGRVQCWGLNDHGQLGNGTTIDSAAPVTVCGS